MDHGSARLPLRRPVSSTPTSRRASSRPRRLLGRPHGRRLHAKARDAGKVRIEGKEYVMRDGDVVHFRFNV